MRNTESDLYLFLEESILSSLTTQNFLLVSLLDTASYEAQ